jgi:hypothetical protein
MFLYGGSKILGFQFSYNSEILSKPIQDLSGFELTWYYFGYSYSFAVIIALVQIIGGILLLINKTKLIGAMMIFPILANIILIDFFFNIPRGALANAIVYFCCICLVLYNQRHILKNLILNSNLLGIKFYPLKSGVYSVLIILVYVFFLSCSTVLVNFMLNIIFK